MKKNTLHDIVVVGGGPGGLSAAWELVRHGFKPLVLERTAAVGDVWRHHYDGLKLNTGRVLSKLPGSPIPNSAGGWPTRDDLVRLLESMPTRGGFDVVTGAEVTRIERTVAGDAWLISLSDGRSYHARAVVVATGGSRLPIRPALDGEKSFKGQILHSSAFKNAKDFSGKRVLVVGCGNSAAEIASRLTEYASEVYCSVRTPPHLLPKSILGIPMAGWGLLLRHLPARVSDTLLYWAQRLFIGDLTKFGLPLPSTRLSIKFRDTNVLPTLYVPFSKDIKAGRIRILGQVNHVDGDSVYVDEHVRTKASSQPRQTSLNVDTIILGTGFRTGLEELIPIAGLFDANGHPKVTGPYESELAPQIYFIGQSNPLTGQLREIRIEAAQIAKQARRSLPVRENTPITEIDVRTTGTESPAGSI